jgi:hypothetical protein
MEKNWLEGCDQAAERKKCRGSFAEGPRHPGLSCPPPQWANKKLVEKTFLTQGSETLFLHASANEAEKCLRALFPQVHESVASSACGVFAAARDWAGVNQEAGDFPSRSSLLFFVAAE